MMDEKVYYYKSFKERLLDHRVALIYTLTLQLLMLLVVWFVVEKKVWFIFCCIFLVIWLVLFVMIYFFAKYKLKIGDEYIIYQIGPIWPTRFFLLPLLSTVKIKFDKIGGFEIGNDYLKYKEKESFSIPVFINNFTREELEEIREIFIKKNIKEVF